MLNNKMLEYDGKSFEKKVKVLKALSHPVRLWIVEVLKERPFCVCELVGAIGDSFPSVSRHLHILKEAGIVNDSRQGQKVFYRLTMPCAPEFVECAENLNKIQSKEALD